MYSNRKGIEGVGGGGGGGELMSRVITKCVNVPCLKP